MVDFFNRIVKPGDKIVKVTNNNHGTFLEIMYVVGENNRFGGTLYTISDYRLDELNDLIVKFKNKEDVRTDNIRTPMFIILESSDFKSNLIQIE